MNKYWTKLLVLVIVLSIGQSMLMILAFNRIRANQELFSLLAEDIIMTEKLNDGIIRYNDTVIKYNKEHGGEAFLLQVESTLASP